MAISNYDPVTNDTTITLDGLEVDTLSGWLAWFLDGGSNELYPDAIEILSNILNKLDDA